MLQALYFCEPFRQEVLGYQKRKLSEPLLPGKAEQAALMLQALAEVFQDIQAHREQNGVYEPRRFLNILQKQNGKTPLALLRGSSPPDLSQPSCSELFRGNQHQDAHEFLNFLLNEVAEGLEREQTLLNGRLSLLPDLATKSLGRGPTCC